MHRTLGYGETGVRGRTQILNSVFRRGEVGYFQSGETILEAGEVPPRIYQPRPDLPTNRAGSRTGGVRSSTFSLRGILSISKPFFRAR
jgi:hypothetical protein